MARAKKTTGTKADPWEHYFAMQLTPQEKAAAREEAQKEIERARREGVYERVLERVGKVQWSIPWEELRRDDD